jgi:hypothetical protein
MISAYAAWSGKPKRPGWLAVVKDDDHGKVLWTGTTHHLTMRSALAEAEAKLDKLMKESA